MGCIGLGVYWESVGFKLVNKVGFEFYQLMFYLCEVLGLVRPRDIAQYVLLKGGDIRG